MTETLAEKPLLLSTKQMCKRLSELGLPTSPADLKQLADAGILTPHRFGGSDDHPRLRWAPGDAVAARKNFAAELARRGLSKAAQARQRQRKSRSESDSSPHPAVVKVKSQRTSAARGN